MLSVIHILYTHTHTAQKSKQSKREKTHSSELQAQCALCSASAGVVSAVRAIAERVRYLYTLYFLMDFGATVPYFGFHCFTHTRTLSRSTAPPFM